MHGKYLYCRLPCKELHLRDESGPLLVTANKRNVDYGLIQVSCLVQIDSQTRICSLTAFLWNEVEKQKLNCKSLTLRK